MFPYCRLWLVLQCVQIFNTIFFTVERELPEQVDKAVGAAVLAPAAQLLQEGLEMMSLHPQQQLQQQLQQQQQQQHHVSQDLGPGLQN